MESIRALNGRTREILLAMILVAMVSVYPLLAAHKEPMYDVKTTTIATYQHVASYDYVAELEYNKFYNNRTIISKGADVLYTRLVKRLNITFDYDFMTSVKPTSLSRDIRYLISVECEGKWIKILGDVDAEEYMSYSETPFAVSFNVHNVTKLFDRLSDETGIGNAKRCIRITPIIDINAKIEGRKVEERYVPELCVYFEFDDKVGRFISLVGLEGTEVNRITEEERMLKVHVKENRGMSAVFSSTAFSGVIIASVLYVQNRPEKTWKDSRDRLVREYKDYVIGTRMDPVKGLMVHEVETMEELVRISEFRMKPIMLYENGHLLKFYIVDDRQKYQHQFRDAQRG